MGMVHSLDIPLSTIISAVMRKDSYMHYHEIETALRTAFGDRIDKDDLIIGLLEVEINDIN